MASALSQHIDVICQRIQDINPTYDSSIRYVQITRPNIPNQRNRSFLVEQNISLTPWNTTQPNYFNTDISIKFFYPTKTEEYSSLKELIDDSEDIYKSLHYYNGNEYSSNFNCVVNDLLIEKQDEENMTITVSLKLQYSLGG